MEEEGAHQEGPEAQGSQRRPRTPLELKLEAFEDPHFVSSRCEHSNSLSYLHIRIYKNPIMTMQDLND